MNKTTKWALAGGGVAAALVLIVLLRRRAKAAKGLPPGAKVKAKGGLFAEVVSVYTGKVPEYEMQFVDDLLQPARGKIKIDPSGALMCVDPVDGRPMARSACEPRLSALAKARREQGVPA